MEEYDLRHLSKLDIFNSTYKIKFLGVDKDNSLVDRTFYFKSHGEYFSIRSKIYSTTFELETNIPENEIERMIGKRYNIDFNIYESKELFDSNIFLIKTAKDGNPVMIEKFWEKEFKQEKFIPSIDDVIKRNTENSIDMSEMIKKIVEEHGR